MRPLVSIAVVFLTAFLWVAVTALMLARVNRARRLLRQERKAARIKSRPRSPAETSARNRRARLRQPKAHRREPLSRPKAPHASTRREGSSSAPPMTGKG
jgi:hypothetical protein